MHCNSFNTLIEFTTITRHKVTVGSSSQYIFKDLHKNCNICLYFIMRSFKHCFYKLNVKTEYGIELYINFELHRTKYVHVMPT